MKKFLLTLGVAAAMGMPSIAIADSGTTSVPVKMTYVDGTNCVLQYQTDITNRTDDVFGEIKEGDTAIAGLNKISGGSVGFSTPAWGVNYITYLQVDISEISGNIISANLSFEASGATDSKRATNWGVGYNNSVWSSDMSYNTADKSITVLGNTKSGTTTSAKTFESYTFDITDAVNNADDDGLVTILIYETAAAGGYVKNPKVDVEWTTASTYHITFKETNDADITVKIDGIDVTSGTEKTNGTYSFTASASGYKNYTGEFTVAGADQEVEFTMTPKETWNFSVNAYDSDGNLLGEVKKGTGYENDNVTYYYPEYYQQGSTLFSKARNSSNPYWGAEGNLDQENTEFKVTYNGTKVSDVVFYKEAEEIEGFTSKNTNAADIRCSNGLGGIVDGEVLLTTLPSGKYKIFGQVWGTKGLQAGVKTKAESEESEDKNLWVLDSTGSLTSSTSEEFTITEETDLYVYTSNGNDNHMLDLIYITGQKIDVANYTIKFVDGQGNAVKDAVTRKGLVGDPIVLTDEDKAEISGTDVKYTFEKFDPENPTIGADGNTVVTVKFNKVSLKTIANYTIKFVDENNKEIKDAEVKEGTIGAEITLPEEYLVETAEIDGQKYFYKGNDLDNKTVAADGSTVITISYRKAEEFNYTVKAKGIDTVIATGKCIEGESETVTYSKYILTEDGKVYSISTKNYSQIVTPDKDNFEVELDYAETDINDGMFFAEAESVLTPSKQEICSNMAGAFAKNDTEFCTLKPGIYKVTIGTYNSGSPTYTIKAGEKVVLSQQAKGTGEYSADFTISVDSKITFQGGDSSRLLDYILITGKEVKEADYTLQYVIGEGEDMKVVKPNVTKKGNVGKAIVLDKNDIAPFQTEDATYTCISNDAEGKIVTIEGTVVTITCKKTQGYVLHFVDQDDEDGHVIKDDIEIPATVGSAIVVPDEHKQSFNCKEHGVMFVYVSDDSEGRTVSEKADIIKVYCQAVTANYTLDYVVDGKSIKTETKTGRVGETIEVAPEDLGEIKDADGNSYIFTGEAPEETRIAQDGSTVLTIKYKQDKLAAVDAIEGAESVKVYDLNGHYVADEVEGLKAGIYIIRKGNTAKKVIIR